MREREREREREIVGVTETEWVCLHGRKRETLGRENLLFFVRGI